MLMQAFCEATGLSRDTVRFYVKRGLLTRQVGAGAGSAASDGGRGRSATQCVPRPSNRYQVFDAAQVERAHLIRAAQQLGFTLAEIADLAAAYETGGLSREKKIALLRAHLRGLDERAERLRAVRRYLTAKVRWLEGGQVGAPPVTPALLRAEPVSAGQRRRSRVSVR